MNVITSLEQLLQEFPPTLIHHGSSETHTPCPFCFKNKAEGKLTIFKDRGFVGEDRMYWTTNAEGVGCRHCGFHSYKDLAELLFGPHTLVSPNLAGIELRSEERLLAQLDENYIQSLHAQVKRDYWYAFGWTDAIIDKFKLGYGLLYRASQYGERHIIPFKPYTNQGMDGDPALWCLEGRLADRTLATDLLPYNSKTAGLGRKHFWKIIEGNSQTAVIVEGLKDGISAYVLGYRHIFAVLGSATSRKDLMASINAENYEKIIVFGDHDEAGDKLNREIRTLSLYPVFRLVFPPDSKQGYDLTDLLAHFGLEAAQEYISKNLTEIQLELQKGFIADFRQIDPTYQPPTPEGTTTLLEVRKDLPNVIMEYINNYALRRKRGGSVKVLAAPPGSGKTYALIKAVEAKAKESLVEFADRKAQLISTIDSLEETILHSDNPQQQLLDQIQLNALKHKLNTLSCATVLYVGPYKNLWDDLTNTINPDLWYNYQARDEDNCENLEVVSALTEKGYVARTFCEKACPLREACLRKGYLAQDELRRMRPITYARHQMLTVQSFVSEYDYLVIDENPLAVFDSPLKIEAKDLYPVALTWEDLVEPAQIDLINKFVTALRLVCNTNIGEDKTALSGREYMDLLNTQLNGQLAEVVNTIDDKILEERYQPPSVVGDINFASLPNRCIPKLFSLIKEELPFYVKDDKPYNTGLHLKNGKMQIYPLQKLKLPSRMSVVIADGTAFPDLYGMLLGRDIEPYAPMIYSDLGRLTVYYGSDFTRSSINGQTKKMLIDFDGWLESHQDQYEDIFGETLDLNKIASEEEFYESPFLKKIFQIIKATAEKHDKLLVVVYKSLRKFLEFRLRSTYPDLAEKCTFVHYGALRGLNTYKSTEACLLIGCPRVPRDLMHEKVMAWAKFIPDMEYIPPEFTLKAAPYHGLGLYSGYSFPTFAHPFAQRFVDMLEIGEIQQATDRIRLFTSGETRYAYLALSRPSSRWINALEPVNKLVRSTERERDRDVYNFLKESYVKTHRFPSQKEILGRFHVGRRVIADLQAVIKEELK